jgi:hypothetical protein
MEIGQRGLRTQHAEERGEFHVILTWDEFHAHSKRLSALYALGFDVRVVGGESDRPARQRPAKRAKPRRRRRPAAREQGAETADAGALPAPLAAKIAAARSKVERPGYVDKVYAACSRAALSPEEIAEALGTTSPSTLNRVKAAARALQEQGLLVRDGERYRVDEEEIRRLTALAELGEQLR